MNKKNKILRFRNKLAEEGIEVGVEEAMERYSAIRSLIKRSRNMSQLDIWKLEEMKPMEGFSKEDYEELINLYKYLIENEV